MVLLFITARTGLGNPITTMKTATAADTLSTEVRTEAAWLSRRRGNRCETWTPMTGMFILGVRSSTKKSAVRGPLLQMCAVVSSHEGPVIDDFDAPPSVARWFFVEPTDRARMGSIRRSLGSNLRSRGRVADEDSKALIAGATWWRDVVGAVHGVAGAPVCFLTHWYTGLFATERVTPRSWTALQVADLTSGMFNDLDFDQAFVIE